MSTTRGNERPVRTRRRGKALETAIYEAAIAECAEVGFGRLTLGGIAQRARTGKAGLYRRWSSPQELLLDALENLVFPAVEPVATGELRGELLQALRNMADSLSGKDGPPAMVLLGDVLRHPEFVTVFRARLIEPRLQAIGAILRRAADRGEIPARAVTALTARTGPAQVLMHYLITGAAPDDAAIEAVVDQVLLPALHHAP